MCQAWQLNLNGRQMKSKQQMGDWVRHLGEMSILSEQHHTSNCNFLSCTMQQQQQPTPPGMFWAWDMHRWWRSTTMLGRKWRKIFFCKVGCRRQWKVTTTRRVSCITVSPPVIFLLMFNAFLWAEARYISIKAACNDNYCVEWVCRRSSCKHNCTSWAGYCPTQFLKRWFDN